MERVRFESRALRDQNQMSRLDFAKIPTAHILKMQQFKLLHVQKGFGILVLLDMKCIIAKLYIHAFRNSRANE